MSSYSAALWRWVRSIFVRGGADSLEPERVSRTTGGTLGPTIDELRALSSLGVQRLEMVNRRTGTADLFDEPLDSDDEEINAWWLQTQVRQR